jgi:general secretion pathway protein C
MIRELIRRLDLKERFRFGEGAALSQFEQWRRGFILAVMTILIYQSVGIFYQAVTLELIRPGGAGVEAAEEGKPAVLKREDQAFYRLIVERNLFGSTDKTYAEKVQATGAPEVQPLSALLELKGTVAGDSKYAFAVIEEKGRNNKQGLYKIGEKVAGATLLKIQRDKVVVRYQDKEETLKKRDMAEGPIVPGGPAPAGAPAAPASGTVAQNRADIMGSLKDLGTMLSQAQIRPYFTRGLPDGFMVSGIRPGSVYQRMGLTDGDILQEINGRKMKGADDMMELYNNLRSSGRMNLNVQRQGRTETINYVFH